MKKLKFLARSIAWVKNLFTKLDKLKDDAVAIAVKATQAAKKAVESGDVLNVVNFLKILLPDEGDELIQKLYDFSKEMIPKLAVRLEIISNEELKNISNENDLKALYQKIFDVSDTDLWEKFWSQYSQEYLTISSDNNISWAESGVATKLYFDTYKSELTT